MTYFTITPSPIGDLLLTGDGVALTRLYMCDGPKPVSFDPGWERNDSELRRPVTQLAEYFVGERREFELALAPAGNPFERRVWAALRKIPYGETASYGEIAKRIDAPTAARAVGLANGRNPISLVIPCHRVIGADGSLTGYGGGLPRKRFLLDLESGALPLLAVLT